MKPYDLKDAFEMYKDAVDRKSDASDKRELKGIEKAVQDCYINYETHFGRNDLEYMPQAQVGRDHKAVLKGLYGSQCKLVKDFRKRYFEINPQTYNNLCPYCVINSSNTTEHILPEDKYPELAVNVKNLIPGCSECNSAKGEDVLDNNGKKIIINYYTDLLPNVQFLFVDINNVGGELVMRYRMENVGSSINTDSYSLIERHFKRLHLIDRYDVKAIQEIAEIKNHYLVENFSNDQEYDVFAAKQRNKCNLDIPMYGINHWRVVLYKACADSAVFKQYIMNKLTATP